MKNSPSNQPDRYEKLREEIRQACGPLPDGATLPDLSKSALAHFIGSPQKLLPLSEAARDMVIGTILGDGSMGWTTTFPRYRARHCTEQSDYCQSKLDLLRDYCNSTIVKEEANGGWGDDIVGFSTMTTPVFEFTRYLCYRPDLTKRSGLRKAITKELVEQLNWRQIAWWFQDDGCKQHRAMNFSTHAFPREEVELLSEWFQGNGVEAKPNRVSKDGKEFWILAVSTAGAKVLAEKIRPFMHPSLYYKLPEFAEALPCEICGGPVAESLTKGPTANVCSASCAQERDRLRDQRKYQKLTPEQRKARYKASQEALRANPERLENYRDYHNKRNNDPEQRKKFNAWRREDRRKKRAAGIKDKRTQKHTCQYCQKEFENTATHQLGKRSPIIYCTAPACVEKWTVDYKEIKRTRAREKRAQDKKDTDESR